MNITELQNFRITDAVNFHEDLNPQLYLGGKMRSDIRQKLLDIAEHFQGFLGVENLALKDITVSGSNAAYSYTPHSDIDLHLIVDFTHLPNDDVYRELFDAKKWQYNEWHDIKVKGYDVELYVQDAAQPHTSLGEYSVLHDEWNRIPTKQRANLDDVATRMKYEKLKELAVRALAANDEQFLNMVLDIVKRYRRAGLAEKGEFGPENLAFKLLRKSGLFKKLWDLKRSFTSRDLSLETENDPVDTDLERDLAIEYEGRQTPESVIKRLYAARNNIFDEFDYDRVYEDANNLSMFEAEYEGNIGAMEVMQFYHTQPKEVIDLLTRLIAANKTKEAWQLIQKVTGTQLKGKEFNEDVESELENLPINNIVAANLKRKYPAANITNIFDMVQTDDGFTVHIEPDYLEYRGQNYVGVRVIDAYTKQYKGVLANSIKQITDKMLLIAPKAKPALIIYSDESDGAWDGMSKKLGYELIHLDREGNVLNEGVGLIRKGSNVTPDVGEAQTRKEAEKLGFKTTDDGVPPTLKTNGKAK